MRGNEYQQIYVCSLLVDKLQKMESEGRITKGKKILVVPCCNPYSVNVKKRFFHLEFFRLTKAVKGVGKKTAKAVMEALN